MESTVAPTPAPDRANGFLSIALDLSRLPKDLPDPA
jgi:hypothetical protein